MSIQIILLAFVALTVGFTWINKDKLKSVSFLGFKADFYKSSANNA